MEFLGALILIVYLLLFWTFVFLCKKIWVLFGSVLGWGKGLWQILINPPRQEESKVATEEKIVDIRYRIDRLKEESKSLSNWLHMFWIAFIGAGILLFTWGRRGPIGVYFAVYLVVFLFIGRLLAEKYKRFYLKKGDLYMDMKKYDAALESYRRVDNLKGHKNEEASYKVALCLDRMERDYEAMGAYQAYIKNYKRGRWKDEAQASILAIKEERKEKREEKGPTKSEGEFEGEIEQVEESLEEKSFTPPAEESLPLKVVATRDKKLGETDFSSTYQPGDKVGNYILENKISQGGFGEVWRAHHHLLTERIVALKIPTHDEYISQLKSLGVIQTSLKSPYIVQPEHIELDTEPPHLAMEYIDGVDLRSLLEAFGTLTVKEAVFVLRQLIRALGIAHEKGIVHRDIKPENILIDVEGNVKITDFELGKVQTQALSASLAWSQTEENEAIKGTLLYMAPEQMQGEETDQRADIYALGIVLFEMLTGELPQPGDYLEDFDPEISPALEEIFEGCYTRKDRRFSSVDEIEEILDEMEMDS